VQCVTASLIDYSRPISAGAHNLDTYNITPRLTAV
jgi:hypothetical protein